MKKNSLTRKKRSYFSHFPFIEPSKLGLDPNGFPIRLFVINDSDELDVEPPSDFRLSPVTDEPDPPLAELVFWDSSFAKSISRWRLAEFEVDDRRLFGSACEYRFESNWFTRKKKLD